MAYNINYTSYVKFLRGTKDAWAAIPDESKDKDTLYFIADSEDTTGSLYLGNKIIGGNVDPSKLQLDKLNDVLVTELINNSVLVYDEIQQKWINKPIENTVPVLIGASDSLDGSAGLVPQPKQGDHTKFLRGDGTWAEVTVSDSSERLNILIGEDEGKSVRQIAQEETAKIIGAAPEDLNTLEEIVNYIKGEGDAATVIADVQKLKNTIYGTEEITGLEKRVTTLETLLGDSGEGLQNQITTIIGDVTALQKQVEENTTNIAALDQRMKWQDIVLE